MLKNILLHELFFFLKKKFGELNICVIRFDLKRWRWRPILIFCCYSLRYLDLFCNFYLQNEFLILIFPKMTLILLCVFIVAYNYLCEHVVHLVGTDRVNEIMYVSVVSVHRRQLSSDEVPLFIRIPDKEIIKNFRIAISASGVISPFYVCNYI